MAGTAREREASIDGAAASPLSGTWPHQLSHEPSLRVSDVLRHLSAEFPALTPSKLRFLDNSGIVRPRRTASGYRKYSAADLERLRFVLREQRDFYRPLGVIQDHLQALDRGELRQAITPRALQDEARDFVPAATLAALAGVSADFVEQLDQERIITASTPGGFDRSLAALVSAASAYVAGGGDLRGVRVVRNAAEREVERAVAAGQPSRARGEAGEADAIAADRARVAVELFAACVEQQLKR